MQDDRDNFVAFGLFIDDLKRYYGEENGELKIAIENYLKQACGVTDDELNSIRRILQSKV